MSDDTKLFPMNDSYTVVNEVETLNKRQLRAGVPPIRSGSNQVRRQEVILQLGADKINKSSPCPPKEDKPELDPDEIIKAYLHNG